LNILTAYAATEGLLEDAAQARVVEQLAELQHRLVDADRPRKGFMRFLRIRKARPLIPGVYLWGDVGRGKTFLMDLFFESLAIKNKKRIHFHRMMSEVHARLQSAKGSEDPLDLVAASISAEIRVLCFDEFFVSDIGDAMILGRLLEGLFRRGVTLVTTSNSPPADLYKDGLQRERFVPAIVLLQEHTHVVQLDAGADYRLRLLQKAGTFFSSADKDTEQRLSECIREIAPGKIDAAGSINILSRSIPTQGSAKSVVWFTFEDICGGPRSQQDYIEIARFYQTVIISNIPVLTRELDDEARRFIALVDEFYDRHVKLIISSAANVDSLYRGTRLQFEFERTESRLVEMQSDKYLHSAHLS
jgi:cell division protein ZapE